MIASRELFTPISCILLVTHFQMFQECCPIIEVEDRNLVLDVTPHLIPPEAHGLKETHCHAPLLTSKANTRN